MRKRTDLRNVQEQDPDRLQALFHELSQEELKDMEKAKLLLHNVREQYGLTFDVLVNMLEQELSFPVSILNKKLTILESVVKHLKEDRNLKLRNIAGVLGRDERNIWHIYNKAAGKYPEIISPAKTKYRIPVSVLSKTKLSALEAVAVYLKDEFSLTYHETAALLKRDDRTICTVYQRAKKKMKL